MDTILEVLGIRTREHVKLGAVDSLQQWSSIHRCNPSPAAESPSATPVSPVTDSAFGDEVDEAVQATDYVETSTDGVHS